ncbi:hypothetical protein FACS1894133_5420 [Clostridia bacterium]|nr:hypothetical protein FACS1894133_5420 [Clostridia bacterium]
MIYITGDVHGDFRRFRKIRGIKRGDTLIICGDFGFIWDGGKREQRILAKIGKLSFNVTFVDGVHENFKLLRTYEREVWNGGETLHICGNLRYLCRGQVFDINGSRVFTFGGGAPDHDDILPAGFDVRDCAAEQEEFDTAVRNLDRAGNAVDYVVTYEPPVSVSRSLALKRRDTRESVNFLDTFASLITFKKWYFGKFHVNKQITSKYVALFDKSVKPDGKTTF